MIWKQRFIECHPSGMSVKEWRKEHGLDFTTYYSWEIKILTSIVPAEDLPVLPAPSLPPVSGSQNAIVKRVNKDLEKALTYARNQNILDSFLK